MTRKQFWVRYLLASIFGGLLAFGTFWLLYVFCFSNPGLTLLAILVLVILMIVLLYFWAMNNFGFERKSKWDGLQYLPDQPVLGGTIMGFYVFPVLITIIAAIF